MKNIILSIVVFVLLILEAMVCHTRAASVTLAWDHSPDAASTTNAITYRLMISGVPGHIGALEFDAKAQTSMTVTNLVGGIPYAFKVFAVDANGVWSDPSDTVFYTPSQGSPPSTTNYFTMIQRIPAGGYRVTLKWHPAPPEFMVTNYLMVADYSGGRYTNHVGTNLTGSMDVGDKFPLLIMSLQAENNQGFSATKIASTYTRPGAAKITRISQP